MFNGLATHHRDRCAGDDSFSGASVGGMICGMPQHGRSAKFPACEDN